MHYDPVHSTKLPGGVSRTGNRWQERHLPMELAQPLGQAPIGRRDFCWTKHASFLLVTEDFDGSKLKHTVWMYNMFVSLCCTLVLLLFKHVIFCCFVGSEAMTVDSNGLIFVDQNSNLAWWISRLVDGVKNVLFCWFYSQLHKNHWVTWARQPSNKAA